MNLSDKTTLYGENALSDEELMVLAFGGCKTPARIVAGIGLKLAQELSIADMQKLNINKNRAIQLKAILELSKRLITLPIAERLLQLCNTDDVVAYFKTKIGSLKHEELHVVLVDCRNKAMRIDMVAQGGLVGLSVHPREVFVTAIREAAAGIILVHNHPSGNPEPSLSDRELTYRVRQAGEIIGIPLLDHVIVTADKSASIPTC